MRRESTRAWRFAGALCGLVVAVDQSTKALVESNLVPGQEENVLGPIDLTLAHNRGIAFGLAEGGGWMLIALGAVGLVVLGAVFARNLTRPWAWVAAGLFAGGALGNLIDRVREGAVADFVSVGPWPPFNLADVAITGGVLLLVIGMYLDGRAHQEPASATEGGGEAR